ncbi:MAG: O-antigen polysaccharide polymerase Wzy [Moraxellaceae bacterium]|nr:O-antigen polysaccharide polymerase Wzy [Moraxellaceae bacterium]
MKIYNIQRLLLIVVTFLGLVSVSFVSFGSFSLHEQYNGYTISSITLFVSSIVVLLLAGVNKAASQLYFSFFMVFIIFHLGIPLGAAIAGSDAAASDYLDSWFLQQYTVPAILSVFLFMASYLLAYLVTFTRRVYVPQPIRLNEFHFKILFYVLCVLVFVWITFVKVVYSVQNYSEYYEFAEVGFLQFIYVYFNGLIGFIFVLLCLSGTYRRYGIALFFVWAIFAFPIGLRGGVLFPLAVSVPVLVSRGALRVSLLSAVSGMLVILLAISFVFNYRGEGSVSADAQINPVAAIIEMGGSLRPVFEVHKWIETQDVNYMLGETYWAPFERTLSKLLPFVGRIESVEDERLMNVMIVKKAGPYGFSIVAEAFINFGWLGVIAIGFVVGCLLRHLDWKISQSDSEGFSYVDVALAMAIFFHIRQSFVGAYGTFLSAIVVCAAITLMISYFGRVSYLSREPGKKH